MTRRLSRLVRGGAIRQQDTSLACNEDAGKRLTSDWFDDQVVGALAEHYRGYDASEVSYATVRDFVDSFDHMHPLATAQGDLKDVQRPWTLKTLLSRIAPGGRVLEIGAGQPYVADLLFRLGYEVWIVDPYDGSGNGPVEFERFQRACPGIHFVREHFSDQLNDVPAGAFDCVYSISVLEHIEMSDLEAMARGLIKVLRPTGWSIHAVDHVFRGNGEIEHLAKLRVITDLVGLRQADLDAALSALPSDTETYYLSAESHNRWRGSTPYGEFPMRVCVSVQLVSQAAQVAGAVAGGPAAK